MELLAEQHAEHSEIETESDGEAEGKKELALV